MRNKYEFDIADIESVIIKSKSEGHYTVIYERKLDENRQPTREFVRSYDAEPDPSPGNGEMIVLCSRCETWNTVSKMEFDNPNYKFRCNHCSEDYEDIVTEDDLVSAIAGSMDPDVYFDIWLFINGIEII